MRTMYNVRAYINSNHSSFSNCYGCVLRTQRDFIKYTFYDLLQIGCIGIVQNWNASVKRNNEVFRISRVPNNAFLIAKINAQTIYALDILSMVISVSKNINIFIVLRKIVLKPFSITYTNCRLLDNFDFCLTDY